jgi:long-chain fatty acid transport protein
MNTMVDVQRGHIFDQSPVPERTLDPLVPDADAHLLSFDIGYRRTRFEIDIACMVMLLEDRHTRRNTDGLNGKYESTGVSLVLGFTTFL